MKNITRGLLILLLSIFAASSFAEEVKMAAIVPKSINALPKTGQTVEYTVGDDGDYQAGNPVSPRFVDNNDGTITDNATGLMWVADPNLCGGDNYPNLWALEKNRPRLMVWADAIANCEALIYAGHNDWRLPNVKELQSIVHYGRSLPTIDTSFFTGSLPNFYWSSTTSAVASTQAWAVYFDLGIVQNEYKLTTQVYVRPVRGGR